MGRPKGSKGKKDESSDSNVEMYENTRNRMLGTSKVIRLMKLWKVPEQFNKECENVKVIVETER